MKVIFLIVVFVALIVTGCGKGKSAKANEASLPELNRMVATLTTHSGGKILSTNDVAKFLEAAGQTFPTPPPGQHLVLDTTTRKFVFVKP